MTFTPTEEQIEKSVAVLLKDMDATAAQIRDPIVAMPAKDLLDIYNPVHDESHDGPRDDFK